MSEHRYPCTAQPGALLAGLQTETGHRHECIHDAVANNFALVEHQCSCGMTWRVRREQGAPFGSVQEQVMRMVTTEPRARHVERLWQLCRGRRQQ